MTEASTNAAEPWVELARAAALLGPHQIDRAESALAALPAEVATRFVAALSGLASLEPGVEAVREAGRRLGLVRGTGGPVRPGGDATRAAFYAAAECALHGLVARSGAAVARLDAPEAAASALLEAVRKDLAVFPRGSAPGAMLPPGLERELRLGLGPPLYLKVAATAANG